MFKEALEKLDIINRFQFGHNMLKSTVSLEQTFSQIKEILNPIVKELDKKISDINVSEYNRDDISPYKINLCYYQLKLKNNKALKTYFILLNPRIPASYIELTNDEINNLLLNGVNSYGWYLLNQVDCLEDFVSDANVEEAEIKFIFEHILTAVIKKLFDNHEKDYSINAHYTSLFNNNLTNIKEDIDKIIDNIQIQTSFTAANNKDEIFIHGRESTLKTYSESVEISELTMNSIPSIINSKYLMTKSSVSTFFKNFKHDSSNIKFFYYHGDFKRDGGFSFLDDNYSVTTQITGRFKVIYSDGSDVEMVPNCPVLTISKTLDEIFFIIMLYSPSFLSKTVDHVECDNIRLIYKLTGDLNI